MHLTHGIVYMVMQGGYVDCSRGGVWRVQGSLAVSRGIGDRHLKQWVTAEPETKILAIEPDFEFLILASDGLWDKVFVSCIIFSFYCLQYSQISIDLFKFLKAALTCIFY